MRTPSSVTNFLCFSGSGPGRISSDHPEWGEDRIALELKAKLGVEHAASTIRRYLQFGTRRPGKTGRSYRSALDLWLGKVLDIKGVPTPYGAPNAQAHIERFMGSLRRECLVHFIFLSEDHLRRTVVAYVAYYNQGRPHQGIEGIPECGPGLPRAARSGSGPIRVVARSVLGGLHHDYRRAA